MKSAERASLRSLLVLAALAAVVFLAALLIGSSGIGVRRALEALGGSGDAATRSVLLGVRLPRVLAAFGVGSLLALSGVLLQALFRNPLADPYVLGVSGGAAVGALLAMIAGAAALLVQSAAVAGALAAVGTVYVLARGGGTPRMPCASRSAPAITASLRPPRRWPAGCCSRRRISWRAPLRARASCRWARSWRWWEPRSSWRCCGAAADKARASWPPAVCGRAAG